jgi:hypothetical protein
MKDGRKGQDGRKGEDDALLGLLINTSKIRPAGAPAADVAQACSALRAEFVRHERDASADADVAAAAREYALVVRDALRASLASFRAGRKAKRD